MLNDIIVGWIRTAVPAAIGAALTWLAVNAGVVLDDDSATGLKLGAAALVIACYYAVAKALEVKYPAAGRVLLALGLTGKRPTYAPPLPPASNDQTVYPSQRR
jgi:hypothetical protein